MRDCKQLILKEINKHISLETKNFIPSENESLVAIKSAAINHRDLWIMKGNYSNIRLPCVLGSDGAGLLDGSRVLIQPGINWGKNESFQSKNYHIVGMPSDGTFSQMISISPEQLHPIPEHLDFYEAAALPLAGLTAWRALFTKGKPQKEDKVLITGIGGGVALAALKFALALDLKVYVTSGQHDKIKKAQNLGAQGGVSYKDPAFAQKLKEMAGGFDIVIDSAGGDAMQDIMSISNPGARLVMYGGTLGKMNSISPQILFWKQLSLLGTTMGSPGEFKEMLSFVQQYRIKPVIDSVFSLEDYSKAFERVASGDHFGKVVFDIS